MFSSVVLKISLIDNHWKHYPLKIIEFPVFCVGFPIYFRRISEYFRDIWTFRKHIHWDQKVRKYT